MTPEQMTAQKKAEHQKHIARIGDAIWGSIVTEMIREAEAKRQPEIPDIQELDPTAARTAGSELAALIIEQTLAEPRNPEEILQDHVHNVLEKDKL